MELGRGEDVFLRGVDGLRRWQAHRRSGVEVHPADAPLAEGTVVALVVPVTLLHITVACRVVSVTDEPARFRFSYGTLPEHVIEGEEAFVVERGDDDVVRFSVIAFLRPRGALMSAVGPLVHLLDQRIVPRYLRGMQQHVGPPPPRPRPGGP